jgi:hypothetical protein
MGLESTEFKNDAFERIVVTVRPQGPVLILAELPHLLDRLGSSLVERQAAKINDRPDHPRISQQLAPADVCVGRDRCSLGFQNRAVRLGK